MRNATLSISSGVGRNCAEHGENSVLLGAGEAWGAGQQNSPWILLQAALEGSCWDPEQDFGGVSTPCDVSELKVQFVPGKLLPGLVFPGASQRGVIVKPVLSFTLP